MIRGNVSGVFSRKLRAVLSEYRPLSEARDPQPGQLFKAIDEEGYVFLVDHPDTRQTYRDGKGRGWVRAIRRPMGHVDSLKGSHAPDSHDDVRF